MPIWVSILNALFSGMHHLADGPQGGLHGQGSVSRDGVGKF